MKNLILPLVLFSMIFVTNCKKEEIKQEEFCWDCSEQTIMMHGIDTISISNKEVLMPYDNQTTLDTYNYSVVDSTNNYFITYYTYNCHKIIKP
jgi:activator of 2-hydroxyglutaryl-CoA dehydratase